MKDMRFLLHVCNVCTWYTWWGFISNLEVDDVAGVVEKSCYLRAHEVFGGGPVDAEYPVPSLQGLAPVSEHTDTRR